MMRWLPMATLVALAGCGGQERKPIDSGLATATFEVKGMS